jgi:hypothetical protein
VSTDLADPAPGSPLRRTGPSRHQTIKAKAHSENDPATPNTRLSDRTTKSSALQSSTGAVIFDPVVKPINAALSRQVPSHRCRARRPALSNRRSSDQGCTNNIRRTSEEIIITRGIHRRLCPAIPRFLLLDDGNHDEGLEWLGPPQPEEGIEQQTGKKDAGQVVQNSLCLASACMAALPSARPILRLARESSGVTIPEKLKTVHVS